MNKVQLYDAMVKLEWIICECEKVSTFGYGRWMFVQCIRKKKKIFIGLWTMDFGSFVESCSVRHVI